MEPPDEAGRVERRIEVEAEHPKRHGYRRILHRDELAPGAVVADAGERVLPEGRCPIACRLESVDTGQDLRNRRGRSPRGEKQGCGLLIELRSFRSRLAHRGSCYPEGSRVGSTRARSTVPII